MTKKNKSRLLIAILAGIIILVNLLSVDFDAFAWMPITNALAMLLILISMIYSIKNSRKGEE